MSWSDFTVLVMIVIGACRLRPESIMGKRKCTGELQKHQRLLLTGGMEEKEVWGWGHNRGLNTNYTNSDVQENNERKKGNYLLVCTEKEGVGASRTPELGGGLPETQMASVQNAPDFTVFSPPLPVIHALICTDIPEWMLPTSAD